MTLEKIWFGPIRKQIRFCYKMLWYYNNFKKFKEFFFFISSLVCLNCPIRHPHHIALAKLVTTKLNDLRPNIAPT